MEVNYFLILILSLLFLMNIDGYTNIYKCCTGLGADNNNSLHGQGAGSGGRPLFPRKWDSRTDEEKNHHVSEVILGNSFTERYVELGEMISDAAIQEAGKTAVEILREEALRVGVSERDAATDDIETIKHLILDRSNPPRISCDHHLDTTNTQMSAVDRRVLSQKHHLDHHVEPATTDTEVQRNAHLEECFDDLHLGNNNHSLFNRMAEGGGISCELLDPLSTWDPRDKGLDDPAPPGFSGSGNCDWTTRASGTGMPLQLRDENNKQVCVAWENKASTWDKCTRCLPGYAPNASQTRCEECFFHFMCSDGT